LCRCRVMACKFLDAKGNGYTSDAVRSPAVTAPGPLAAGARPPREQSHWPPVCVGTAPPVAQVCHDMHREAYAAPQKRTALLTPSHMRRILGRACGTLCPPMRAELAEGHRAGCRTMRRRPRTTDVCAPTPLCFTPGALPGVLARQRRGRDAQQLRRAVRGLGRAQDGHRRRRGKRAAVCHRGRQRLRRAAVFPVLHW